MIHTFQHTVLHMVTVDRKLGPDLVSKLQITLQNNTSQVGVWSHNALLPKATRWHIVYKSGSSLLSDQSTQDIFGHLSAYETLPVPLKYPGVYILILFPHSVCIQECYVRWLLHMLFFPPLPR